MTDNTMLSPTINEKIVERHLRGETSGPLVALRDAARLARQTCEKAAATAGAVLKNEMMMPAARHKQARDTSWSLFENAARAIDAAAKAAETEMAAIRQRTRGPAMPRDLITEARHREIRERLSALPREERLAVLDSAIAAGDDQIAAAVLSIHHSWLVQLSATELEMVRSNWARRNHPDDLDRLARLEKATADTRRIGSLTLGFVDHLTDHERVKTAEVTEREAKAALAAAQEEAS